MKIGTDKWKHFGINYAICALLGDYGVPFALGASLGKEYGDEMSPCNKSVSYTHLTLPTT